MHLSFVPLTADGRLSAKEIVGNKKKLTWWQDKYWEHMVQKYPDPERGESASQTGRDHIPPRIFKEMTRLNKQRQKLDELLTGIGPLNSKKRAAEISKLLDKYNVTFTETATENKRLKKKTIELKQSLEAATKTSVLKELRDVQLKRDYEDALALLERIPKEVFGRVQEAQSDPAHCRALSHEKENANEEKQHTHQFHPGDLAKHPRNRYNRSVQDPCCGTSSQTAGSQARTPCLPDRGDRPTTGHLLPCRL